MTYPFITSISKRFSPNIISESEIIPDDHAILLWYESDIPYLKKLTHPDQMEQSLNRRVNNAKVGAKITDCVQPVDVDSGFKVLKSSGRTYTAVGRVTLLNISANSTFTKLQGERRLVLATGKHNAIIDCVYGEPKLMNKSFSSEIIKKLCVEYGMLDMTTNTYLDLYAIINLFSINWSKIQGGKQRFVSKIPIAFCRDDQIWCNT